MESKIRQLGLLAGGRPAERICGIFSIPTSDTTILRLVEKENPPAAADVTAVGVDDWAYKKKDRYGSILVNLHTGKVIDLLPDREEETLRKWLEKRPEIEVMTGDRYSNYRKAIATGAPQAVQVTDRWHLLKNLSEAVQKVLIKQYSKANAVPAGKQLRDEARQPVCIRPGAESAYNGSNNSKNYRGKDIPYGSWRGIWACTGKPSRTIWIWKPCPGHHKAVSIHWKDSFPISKSVWRKNPIYT